MSASPLVRARAFGAACVLSSLLFSHAAQACGAPREVSREQVVKLLGGKVSNMPAKSHRPEFVWPPVHTNLTSRRFDARRAVLRGHEDLSQP
jgi:hypothetical protein